MFLSFVWLLCQNPHFTVDKETMNNILCSIISSKIGRKKRFIYLPPNVVSLSYEKYPVYSLHAYEL